MNNITLNNNLLHKILKVILPLHLLILVIESVNNYNVNDNMYITSLVNPSITYDTNGFVQMPYYFLLKIFQVIPIDYHIVLKIISTLLVFLMFWFIAKLPFVKNKLLFWSILSIGYINFIAGHEIGNYSYTYFFLTMSFIALYKRYFFLSGLLFAFSLGFKLSSLVFLLPIFIFVFVKNKKKIIDTIGGIILGLLPLLLFLKSKYFIINNFKFHSEFTNTSRGIYYEYSCISCHLKTAFIALKLFLFNPHNLAFLVLLISSVILYFTNFKSLQKLKRPIVFYYLVLLFISFSVVLVAKAVYLQYLIPFSIVVSFFIYYIFIHNKKVAYGIVLFALLFSTAIRAYSIYDSHKNNQDFLSVMTLRNKIKNKIIKKEITEDIFTLSGSLTSGITSFKKYHDSSVFYPNVGDDLEELGLKPDFSDYYQISIYPHENLESLPKTFIFGLTSGKYEDLLKNSLKQSYKVDSVYIGSYKQKPIYAIIKQ